MSAPCRGIRLRGLDRLGRTHSKLYDTKAIKSHLVVESDCVDWIPSVDRCQLSGRPAGPLSRQGQGRRGSRAMISTTAQRRLEAHPTENHLAAYWLNIRPPAEPRAGEQLSPQIERGKERGPLWWPAPPLQRIRGFRVAPPAAGCRRFEAAAGRLRLCRANRTTREVPAPRPQNTVGWQPDPLVGPLPSPNFLPTSPPTSGGNGR